MNKRFRFKKPLFFIIIFFQCNFLFSKVKLDSNLVNSDIVLLGELHYAKGNYDLFFETFKSLCERSNFTEIILEDGPGKAYLLSRYLDSGDEIYLRQFLMPRAEMSFYKKLLNYKSTHNLEKISFHGIDYEDEYIHLVKALEDVLFLNKNLKKSFKEFRHLSQWEKDRELLIIAHDDLLINELESFQGIWDKKIADSLIDFKDPGVLEINSLLKGFAMTKRIRGYDYNSCKNVDMLLEREKIMAKNLMDAYASRKGRKFFGQLGALHTQPVERSDGFHVFMCLETWESLCLKAKRFYSEAVQISCVQIVYTRRGYRGYNNKNLSISRRQSREYNKLVKSQIILVLNKEELLEDLPKIAHLYDYVLFFYK